MRKIVFTGKNTVAKRNPHFRDLMACKSRTFKAKKGKGSYNRKGNDDSD